MIELFGYFFPEEIPGTTWGYAPTRGYGIGIGPQEVAHGALVGDFLDSFQLSDTVKGVEGGGETAVEGEYL